MAEGAYIEAMTPATKTEDRDYWVVVVNDPGDIVLGIRPHETRIRVETEMEARSLCAGAARAGFTQRAEHVRPPIKRS